MLASRRARAAAEAFAAGDAHRIYTSGMVPLVTGATGFIGSHLVASLLDARRDEVRALVRGSGPRPNVDALVAKGLKLCEGDLLRPESLDRALDGVSAVYHAAGLISTRRRDAGKVEELNYTATMNLWRACRRGRVARICYVGAPIALAGGSPRPVSEDAPFTLVDLDVPYVRAKRRAELATRDEIERGLPVISVYPAYCLGPGDSYFSSLKPVDLFLRGLLFAIVDGGMGSWTCATRRSGSSWPWPGARSAAEAIRALQEKGVHARASEQATGHEVVRH